MTRAWKKYKYHDHTETRKFHDSDESTLFSIRGNKLINSFSET